MAELDDVRRRFPPEDPEAYARAYAEAELAGELGVLVHDLRVAAGLSEHDLAERMGVGEDDVARAEEGDDSLSVGFLDRLGRAVGVQLALAAGGTDIRFGAAGTAPELGA